MLTTLNDLKGASIEELIQWLENGYRLGLTSRIPEFFDFASMKLASLTRSQITPEQIERVCRAIEKFDY